MSLLNNNCPADVHGTPGSEVRAGHAPGPGDQTIQEDSPNDYARLLDQYGSVGSLAEGEVVKGRVLKVTAAEVVIDVGYKSEGIIPLQEFIDSDGSVKVKAGDEIDVLLEFA